MTREEANNRAADLIDGALIRDQVDGVQVSVYQAINGDWRVSFEEWLR